MAQRAAPAGVALTDPGGTATPAGTCMLRNSVLEVLRESIVSLHA